MNLKEISTKVWTDPAYFIAFGFGSGLMPVAPGTWGTLAAIPVYLLLTSCSVFVYLMVTLAFFILGVIVSDKVTKDLGVEDYSGIVWDEVVGFLMTMTFAPSGWGWIAIGFILFRIYDIWKPYPIRLIDTHMPGGIGVMLDDALAAVYACVTLQIIVWVV